MYWSEVLFNLSCCPIQLDWEQTKNSGKLVQMLAQAGHIIESTCKEVADLSPLKDVKRSLRWLCSSSSKRKKMKMGDRGQGQGQRQPPSLANGLTPRMLTGMHEAQWYLPTTPNDRSHACHFWKQTQNMFPSVAWLAHKVLFSPVMPLPVSLERLWLYIGELSCHFLQQWKW